MRRIRWLFCFVLLTFAASSRANIYCELDNIDDYLKFGRTIIIVECLPEDEEVSLGNAQRRKVRVLDVLQGELKKDQVIHVVVRRQPFVTSNIFLIYSGETLDQHGDLTALSYEPAVVPINVGEVVRKPAVAWLLKGLEGLPLKDKLLYILQMRLGQLKQQEQYLESEKGRMEKLLLK